MGWIHGEDSEGYTESRRGSNPFAKYQRYQRRVTEEDYADQISALRAALASVSAANFEWQPNRRKPGGTWVCITSVIWFCTTKASTAEEALERLHAVAEWSYPNDPLRTGKWFPITKDHRQYVVYTVATDEVRVKKEWIYDIHGRKWMSDMPFPDPQEVPE